MCGESDVSFKSSSHIRHIKPAEVEFTCQDSGSRKLENNLVRRGKNLPRIAT